MDEIGRVIDPIVIDNCVLTWKPGLEQCVDSPRQTFDKSALAAAARFKYKPKVVNGEPIEVQGVRNIIRFELEDPGGRG